jgi:hypothetical protein
MKIDRFFNIEVNTREKLDATVPYLSRSQTQNILEDKSSQNVSLRHQRLVKQFDMLKLEKHISTQNKHYMMPI